MEEKKDEAVAEALDGQKAFELTVSAKGAENGIAAKLEIKGRPASGAEMEAVPLTAAARSLAFLYDAALVGSGREDNAAERAMFFIGMQPHLHRIFMGMIDSWQFQKTLAEHREAAHKANPEKKEESTAPA